jgi:hypothetical protein
MRAWRGIGWGVVVAGLMMAAGSPVSAAPSGTVVAVIQQSEADGTSGRRVLVASGDIFAGDKIITGPVGEAQIRFRDDTRLVVGPNSQMSIDAFVLSGNTAQDISINAVRGVFRFITGHSPKNVYKFVTPTATVGVRGTEFDINVEPGTGTTRVANFTGITRICPRDLATGKVRGECVLTSGACNVSVVRANRDLWQQKDLRDRNRDLAWYFRWVRNQSGLLEDFQVDVGQCGDITTVAGPPPHESPPSSPPPRPDSEECSDC